MDSGKALEGKSKTLSIKPAASGKQITSPLNTQAFIKKAINPYNRENIQLKAIGEQEKYNEPGVYSVSPDSAVYQMLALDEFENGIMLTNSVSESYRAFILEMYLNLIKEHECQTVTEKSLACTVAFSYCRIMELQRALSGNMNRTSFDQLTINWGNHLGKELEQAYRQYNAGLQLLRSIKLPICNLTVKTKTANIANQQVVQGDNHVKAK